MITKQLNDNTITIKMLNLMRIKGYFEEFSKLNQLIASVVKVWFNKGAREKIQPLRPQQLLPMMMLLFKPIKSEKVINVTFNVFSFFLIPSWKCHLQPRDDIDE